MNINFRIDEIDVCLSVSSNITTVIGTTDYDDFRFEKTIDENLTVVQLLEVINEMLNQRNIYVYEDEVSKRQLLTTNLDEISF